MWQGNRSTAQNARLYPNPGKTLELEEHLEQLEKLYDKINLLKSYYQDGFDKAVNGLIAEHGGGVNTFETLLEAGLIRAI